MGRSVDLLKTSDELPHAVTGPVSRLLLVFDLVIGKSQDHKGADERTAGQAQAHAGAKPPGQFEGGFPVYPVTLAETGQDGLGS